MITRRTLILSTGFVLWAGAAFSQFTGPSVQGDRSTVSSAQDARIGSYLTLEGNIVSHLREDYYLFRDATGEMRVEIAPGRFAGQQVGSADTVRIMGEVDRSLAGRYIWVKSLNLVN